MIQLSYISKMQMCADMTKGSMWPLMSGAEVLLFNVYLPLLYK
jgi:hypothetical protein